MHDNSTEALDEQPDAYLPRLTPQVSPQQRSDDALHEVLHRVLVEGSPLLVVDSPPGAGKTYLVETVVAVAVQHLGLRVAVVAPRAEQTYDIARRLLHNWQPMQIELLQAPGRPAPDDLADQQLQQLSVVSSPAKLAGGPGVVIANVAKMLFAMERLDRSFELLICDEAYQVSWAELAPLVEFAPRVLLVGDPGQLPPLVTVDTERFEAAPTRVHWAAPRELRRRLADLPLVKLPATRRLPPDSVALVQPAFYPELPFGSAIVADERRLVLDPPIQGDAVDNALDKLAQGQSIVALVLPPATLSPDQVDDELASVVAEVNARLLQRHAAWQGVGHLEAANLGAIDAHIASGAAIRRELLDRALPVDALMVDTPEIWQGQERPVLVVKHPLSGLDQLNTFALEPGRWCVMLSRHQLGCVIVTRDGVGQALDNHRHNAGERPLGAANAEWDGWRAHRSIWDAIVERDALIHVMSPI